MKKISLKVYLSIIILSILFIVLVILLISNHGVSSTVVKTFESDYGSFEVKVPKQWKCDEFQFIGATMEEEATPDGGIQININDESIINITVSLSRIYYQGSFQENIKTDGGITAKAYSFNNDGIINQIEFTESIGVFINCSDDIYLKYKQDILDLVKSIKIK